MGGESAKTKRRLAWAGTAVVLGGGINLLQHGIGAVHLRGAVLGLITGLIIVVTTLVSVVQERHNRRQAIEELEESLDVMLACWPPRSASRLTPYDVGVHPSLADVGDSPPYVERDCEADVENAIRETGIAVVFGPPGAGKSRTAFEAVKRTAPDAAMVIPTGADGLAKVMQQARDLPLFAQPTVLWLDGLERFSEALDVDPIDGLVHPEPRGRRVDRIRGKSAKPPRMVVVATIRSAELEHLLGDGAGASHETRRLLAHGRGIPLADTLSGNERRRFEEKYGRKPAGHTVAEAFPRTWSDGWQKPVPHEPLRGKTGIGIPAWPLVLAAVCIGLAVLLIREVHDGGWTEPPPLKTQIGQLSDKVRPCQRLEAFPRGAAGLGSNDVLVAIVHGGDCPVSDEVRFYRQRSKRLKQISALVPAGPGPRQTFSCIGDGRTDPCHVRLAGRTDAIVGAFMNTDTSQEVPLIVSFTPEEGLRLAALSPPAPPPRGVKAVDKPIVTLRLRVGGVEPAAESCEPVQGCLRSRPAAATGVLGPTDDHPAILLAGYVAVGTTDAPQVLKFGAWRLRVPAVGTAVPQRRRDCLVLTDGAPISLEARLKRAADPRDALFASTRPKGSQLMC